MQAELAPLKRLRVLLVAGDVPLALLTIRYLETNGLEVVVALRGSDTLAHVLRWRPDVLILAATLPDACGYEVCRRLRERFDVPIIMIAELPDGADRVQGLEAGADDCVTKPFSTRELLARVHVHARRALRRVNSSADRLQIGELRIDLPARKAFVRGRDADLTDREFKLLLALGERVGQVLSREELLKLLGRPQNPIDRSVDVYVCRLRSKLELDEEGTPLIKTVRGVGYVLVGRR
jgi:DNA-binding response OmpR family regulator